MTNIPIVIGAFGRHQRIGIRTGGFGNNRTNGAHPNYYIIENGQNTENSPGDSRKICCHSNSSERPSAKTDVKNSQGV